MLYLHDSTSLGSKCLSQVNTLSLSICFWKSLFTSRVFFSSFSHSSLHFLFLAFLGNGSFQIVVARWDPTIRVQTARTETEWLVLGLGLTLNLTTTLTNH